MSFRHSAYGARTPECEYSRSAENAVVQSCRVLLKRSEASSYFGQTAGYRDAFTCAHAPAALHMCANTRFTVSVWNCSSLFAHVAHTSQCYWAVAIAIGLASRHTCIVDVSFMRSSNMCKVGLWPAFVRTFLIYLLSATYGWLANERRKW